MNRLIVCVCCVAVITACSFNKQSSSNQNTNQSAETAPQGSPAQAATTQSAAPAQAGDLPPGTASGTYTAKGETVALKYAYAGRAQRFGADSLVVLATETPIPPEAVAEEIKNATLLESEKIRGLEYVLDEQSMWIRFHPSQYQESGSNKLKEFKVENGIVRVIDEDNGDLSNGKYGRSVKLVATIAK